MNDDNTSSRNTGRTLPRLTALAHYFDSVSISHNGTEYTVSIIHGKSTHSFTNIRLGRAISQLVEFYKIKD